MNKRILSLALAGVLSLGLLTDCGGNQDPPPPTPHGAANTSRDARQRALASVVETAGTLCALLAALPLLRAVLDMLMELMG